MCFIVLMLTTMGMQQRWQLQESGKMLDFVLRLGPLVSVLKLGHISCFTYKEALA